MFLYHCHVWLPKISYFRSYLEISNFKRQVKLWCNTTTVNSLGILNSELLWYFTCYTVGKNKHPMHLTSSMLVVYFSSSRKMSFQFFTHCTVTSTKNKSFHINENTKKKIISLLLEHNINKIYLGFVYER